ncbi:hypothetical protein DF121_03355 [Burkholderia stagnalis]|nr:hypothetical protein DF145_00305 [Burkholderia stagnalis]RQY05184.1 hypothetical protein DF121_03355 [Burkholderia stagnalis]RQY22683.1 hypothetical protein DF115_03125 [Burkholderia stagnalis]RQY35720.1 hypothetical protein DF114_03345 [Burkholderia stagnalis]
MLRLNDCLEILRFLGSHGQSCLSLRAKTPQGWGLCKQKPSHMDVYARSHMMYSPDILSTRFGMIGCCVTISIWKRR